MIFILNLINENNTPSYREILRSLQFNIHSNPFSDVTSKVLDKARHATKFHTYVNELNKSTGIHPVYTTNTFIPDYHRESFSRIRLMSHNLKIETGRWSRIPRERRLCNCNSNQLQTEAHILLDCRLTLDVRLKYPMLDFTDLDTLLAEATHLNLLCNYTYEALNIFN